MAFKAFSYKNKKGKVLKIWEGMFTMPRKGTEKYETVFKQYRLCTHSLILSHVFATIVLVEKTQVF
jgi:hypothetical protein